MESVPVTKGHWRTFSINVSLAVLLAVSGLYLGMALSTGRTIEAEITTRARTIVSSVMLARRWNAIHGGVYVERRPGRASPPWLDAPERRGADGTVYSLRSPETMTRELSALADLEGAFRFRLTSLKPLNPANAPDGFEAAALARLEAGEAEVWERERRGEAVVFRYMGPLRVEESCLGCHAGQGDRIGQVRGGVSVSFDVTETERGVIRSRWFAVGLFVVTMVALLLMLGGLVRALHRRLDAAEARIVEMAITDELTGLHNRRYIGQRLREELSRSQRTGRPCSCILFDIDFFKRVNDTHGHAAGDEVLRGVAATAREALRESDLLGRWGGEEFLAVLPDTNLDGAGAMAERLRHALESMRVQFEGSTFTATVSLGVVEALPGRDPDARDAERMVARADEVLYRAKSAGRNRVELG